MLFYTKNEQREIVVPILYDLGDSPPDIAYLMDITQKKVLRILERTARIVPKRCFHCNEKLSEHLRCKHCEILLHTPQERETLDCGECTTVKYYQLNEE